MKQRRFILRILLQVMGILILTSFCYTVYLKFFPPFTTPLMVIRALEAKPSAKGNPFVFQAKWRSMEEISDAMKISVIASEDQRFAYHHGFDFDAMWAALKHNFSSSKKVGGSTISQQVAKNVFLWQSRSYLRKILEIYFTALIELVWGKERILEMYLNVAELGNGKFGVEAAALSYYHIPAARLSAKQSAEIAALLPAPRKWTPKTPLVQRKSWWIMKAAQKIGGRAYLGEL